MTCNHTPVDNVAYISYYFECIDTVNKLHRIFEFGNDIMCTNEIDISTRYKFGLDYVHESMNDSTLTTTTRKWHTVRLKTIATIFRGLVSTPPI